MIRRLHLSYVIIWSRRPLTGVRSKSCTALSTTDNNSTRYRVYDSTPAKTLAASSIPLSYHPLNIGKDATPAETCIALIFC